MQNISHEFSITVSLSERMIGKGMVVGAFCLLIVIESSIFWRFVLGMPDKSYL